MALPDSFSPQGDATASHFDPVAGDFTGMPRDLPGPQERGPDLSFWPPASPVFPGANPTPRQSPVEPDTMFADGQTGAAGESHSVLHAETALSLQQWSAALMDSSKAEGKPVSLPVPAVGEAAGFSLATLADQLSARLVHGRTASPGEMDFWQPEPGAAPAGLLDELDRPPAERTTAEAFAAEDAGPDVTLPTTGVAARSLPAVSSPAGIRAAAGLLAHPPKSSPEPRQGDVFFLDHPAAAHPSAVSSGLEAGDFLLPSPADGPPPSAAAPPAPAWDLPLEMADPQPGPLELQIPRVVAGHSPGTQPPPLPLFKAVLPAAPPPPDAGGTGLVLGGTGLVLLGIGLACHLPLIWLEYQAAEGWPRQLAGSSLLVHAGGSLLAMIAGLGSIFLQRWAVTLVLAAGWLSVFTAALLIGIAAFLLGSDTPAEFSPVFSISLLGLLLVPLGYLLYYEKQLLGPTAGTPAADPVPRSVPLLMMVLTGVALALAAAAMLGYAPALPWPDGKVITGPPAEAAWTALLVAGVLTAFCAWHRRPMAWWLLLLSTAGLCATLSVSSLAGTPPWETFLSALGRPDTAGLPDPFWPAAAGLAPLIPGLVLLMTRRALPSSPPP